MLWPRGEMDGARIGWDRPLWMPVYNVRCFGCCDQVDTGCCDNVNATLYSLLASTTCACMNGLNITLSYGTTFSGAVTLPSGASHTPPCWTGGGVVGWQGFGTACGGQTIRQRIWCCPPAAPAVGAITDFYQLIDCNGVVVNQEVAAGYVGHIPTCDPFSLPFNTAIDATVGNTNCNCGGGLILDVSSLVTET